MAAKARVRDLMSTEVVTLRRNDQLSIADDVMRLGRIRHLPVLDDEGLDERGIPRQGIAEKVLPDTQPHGNDFAGFRGERRWLDPHVMGEERRTAQREGRHDKHAHAATKRRRTERTERTEATEEKAGRFDR